MIRKLTSVLAALCIAVSALIAPAPVFAGAMSDYLENKLIDYVLRGQAYTAPTDVYVGLATTSADDTACGTEVSGNNYSRVSVASSLANWAGTQSSGSTTASSGTGGTTSNNGTISFPTPSGTWGTVTTVCVFDASTSGNLLWYTALTVSKTINSGDTVQFSAGSLTFQIDN